MKAPHLFSVFLRLRCRVFPAVLFFVFCAAALWPEGACAEDAGHNGKVSCPLTFSADMYFAGIIEEVLVQPGDKVHKGQVLARYRLRDEAILSVMDYLDLNRAIVQFHQSLTDNDVKLYGLEEEYTSSKRLSAASMGSADHQKMLRQSVEMLRKNSESLRARIEFEKRNYAERQNVMERKLGLRLELGDRPEHGFIVSPDEGEILFVNPLLRKDMILDGGSLISIGRTSLMEVETRVFESDVPDLTLGGKASVTIFSLEEREYEGTIISISRLSNDMDPDRPSYYSVRLSIPNDEGKLRAGFKAVVRFKKAQNPQ